METNQNLLSKVDEVRARKKVSYEEAKEALELNNLDTLDAVIYLENQKDERYDDLRDYKDKTLESIKKTGSEMVRFSLKGHEIELPIPVVGISSLLLLKKPKLFVGLVLGLLISGTDVTVNRGTKELNLTKPIRKKTKKMVEELSISPKELKKKIDKVTDQISDKIKFGQGKEEEDDFKGYFSTDIY